MKFLLLLTVMMAIALGCSNPLTPKDCIQAAEEAGAPQVVLDFLHNPSGEIGQAERFVVRQFLNQTSLNDVCQAEVSVLDAVSNWPQGIPSPNIVTNAVAEPEGVPSLTISEATSASASRSLDAFAGCHAHYRRAILVLPDGLEVEGLPNDHINFNSSSMWDPLGWFADVRCSEYAPSPKTDYPSGQCIIEAAELIVKAYPELDEYAGALATMSCLPAYEG